MASPNLALLTPERLEGIGKVSLAMLVFGIVIGIFSAGMEFYYIAAAFISLLLIVVFVWNFDIALIIYALVSFSPLGKTPDLMTGGSGAGKGLYVSELMIGFMLIIWVGRYFTNNLAKNRIPTGFYKPLWVYICYMFINVITSFVFWDTMVPREYQNIFATYAQLGLGVLSALALAMMATTLSSLKTTLATMIAFIIPGTILPLNAFLGTPLPFLGAYFAPLLTAFPACFYALAVVDGKYKRTWLRVLALLPLAMIFFIDVIKFVSWVSGIVCLMTALAVTTLLYNWRLFIVCALLMVIVCAIFWPFIQTNIFDASDEEGDMKRFDMFRGSMKFANQFPLGVGCGNYRSYIIVYARRFNIPAYSSAHGTYAQHLAEMGWPGAILLLWFGIGGFVWLVKQILAEENHNIKNFLIAAAANMAGIFVSSSIGDYIIPAYHNGGVATFSTTVQGWLIWGTAIALVRISREEKEKQRIALEGPAEEDDEEYA
ncbi:MAG: hypothetical protein J6332_07140 [Abditibacteriota bacterium]|nr:hypothetical protein [Abditibacteriota bacterium]